MLNGEFCCCEGDVVVRVGNSALVDGVFTDVFTSNAFWCSCQSVGTDHGTGRDGDGEVGVCFAVDLCLGVC